jgi:hypothetical protein
MRDEWIQLYPVVLEASVMWDVCIVSDGRSEKSRFARLLL